MFVCILLSISVFHLQDTLDKPITMIEGEVVVIILLLVTVNLIVTIVTGHLLIIHLIVDHNDRVALIGKRELRYYNKYIDKGWIDI